VVDFKLSLYRYGDDARGRGSGSGGYIGVILLFELL